MALTLLLAAGGFGAGAFGALLGLGGGILVVPLLTLAFGLPFREAVAISLLAVVATSSASAAVYLRRGTANLRLGLTLETWTVVGAIIGGLVAFALDERLLAGAFAIMLVYVAVSMARRRSDSPTPSTTSPRAITFEPAPDEAVVRDEPDVADDASDLSVPAPSPSAAEAASQASGIGDRPLTGARARSLTDSLATPDYRVRNLPIGLALSGLAGTVSALLGVGGGIIKVPAMHLAMGLPLRAATATSNVTIGVTASASAILYIVRDAVDPLVAAPVLVGTFLGANAAARLAPRVPLTVLRWIFVLVLVVVAAQMTLRAIGPGVGA